MTSQPTPPAVEEAVPVVGMLPDQASPAPVSAEHAELQRQGAKAAVRGETSESNPMFDFINKPDATGETEQAWSDRRDAWERGHGSQQNPVVLPPHAPRGVAANESVRDEALFGVTQVLTFAGDKALEAASGFFFERDDRLYLVTCRHVLLGEFTRHAPDRIEVELHTDVSDLTQLATLSFQLRRNGIAVWRQARDSGGEIDVAVLELDRAAVPANCVLNCFGPQHLAVGLDQFEMGDRLAIPAFPPGVFDTVHHLPVVRQASVASCYGVCFQGLDCFLTDARMHRGCSGAPVLARVDPAMQERPRWCLLGVHSSRMDMTTGDKALEESLGLNCAWYADVLMALTAGTSPPAP